MTLDDDPDSPLVNQRPDTLVPLSVCSISQLSDRIEQAIPENTPNLGV